MRSRWAWIAAYVVALVTQLSLLGGSMVLYRLSKQKMMVMRYLFAKNTALEESLFSPAGRVAHVAALLVICVALLGLAVVALRQRRGRFLATQAGIGTVVTGIAAVLLLAVKPSSVIAIYAIVLALWVVIAVQLAIVALAYARAVRA